ncbi:MAG: sugar transferase [Lachnospiraceae bacterium]|nr:sugar transferase [Lachnospiraceae bacterium]
MDPRDTPFTKELEDDFVYKRATYSWMKHIDFILADLLCIHFSMLLAYFLRMYVMSGNIRFAYKYGMYRMLGIVLTILHFCVVFFSNSYSGILRRGKLVELIKVLTHNTVMAAGLISFMYVIGISKQISRLVIIGYVLFSILSMYLVRITMKRVIKNQKVREQNMRHILLISDKENVTDIISSFNKNINDCKIVGIAMLSENTCLNETMNEIPIVANNENDIFEFAVRNVVDETFIVIDNDDSKIVQRLSNSFLQMGVTVHINLSMFTTEMPNVVVEKMNGFTVMTSSINVITPAAAFIKRLTDIVFGIVGCIVTGLLFVFLGPAIKIADPGPVFFSQKRVGKNGRLFTIYKFRSMYQDAEARKKDLMSKNKMEGLMFKMDEDPRIIGSGPDGKRKGLGYWIRTLSLDEFPNFFSILKGDMSLVGTRPPTVDEFKEYSIHHKSRLAAKPGLTGMWQVSGRSDQTDFEEVVALDAEYIKNWSIALDIKIIVKTFFVVIGRKGSI